jgi:hypothetical protein
MSSNIIFITAIAGCITGIIGTITGIIGLTLSILNFSRDKPKIRISLQWDMDVHNIPLLDSKKKWGVVSIANVGRRPIYISHLVLKTPIENRFLIIMEGLSGEKLLEGDSPKIYPVSQDDLEEYAKHWEKVIAVVSDSAGKEYKSKVPKEKPSWA